MRVNSGSRREFVSASIDDHECSISLKDSSDTFNQLKFDKEIAEVSFVCITKESILNLRQRLNAWIKKTLFKRRN